MVYYAPACTPPTHSLHAAPPLPGRDRSRSRYTREHLCPPVAHLTMAALTSGPDRRLTGFYGAIVGSASTFSLRASQRYQPRAVHRSSCPPGFESRVPIHVRPPVLTTTLCPDPSAPAPTLHVLHAAQAPVHRIRTDLARTVPPPRPEHARRHVPPCCAHVAAAHVSGAGMATPGIVGDLSRRDLRVSDGVVSTLPCTSCISSGRRREPVAAGR